MRKNLIVKTEVIKIEKRNKWRKSTAIFAFLVVAIITLSALYFAIPKNPQHGFEVPITRGFNQNVLKDGQFIKMANPHEKIYVTFSLKWRNEVYLDEFLKGVNTKGSPLYHKFMKYQDFKAHFAPPEGIYEKIVKWIKENGVHVQYTYPLHNSITIYDTIGNISKLLNVKMGYFKNTGNPHYLSTYFAAMNPPEVPSEFAPYIAGIDGLTNARAFHIHYYHASSGTDWLTGADVARMYRVYELYNNTPDGSASTKHIFATGLRVATVLWEGTDSNGDQTAPFDPKAIGYYYGHVIPSWIQNLGVNSTLHWHGTSGTVSPGTNTDGSVSEENELDLEMVGTLAPGVDAYCVYGPGNTNSNYRGSPGESNFPDNEYDYIANTLASDSSATLVAVSNSWGGGDYTGDASTDNDIKALNAMGVTVLASSGDDGDTDTPGYPAIDAQSTFGVISVGGTTPIPNGYDITSINDEATMGYNTNISNPRSDEHVWYDNGSGANGNGPGGSNDDWGTQSGVSSNYTEPWFQKVYVDNIIGSTGKHGRATADIAAMAEDTLVYLSDGSGNNQWSGIGGTSVACPVVAGMIAEMAAYVGVQYGVSNHGFGYFLPTIYQLGNDFYNNNMYSSSPPFFDVTETPNGYHNGETEYDARTGWDLATGWGVPNAWELVHDIGFKLTTADSSKTITQGQSATYSIDVSFPYMWTCDVGHFTVSGLPTDASASTNVNYVHPQGNGSSQSITLTISTTASTPAGTYTFLFTGYSYNHTTGHWGNLTYSLSLNLTINPGNAPDLTITGISTSATSVNEGDTLTIYATVKNVGNENANNVYVGFYYDSVSSSTHIGNVSVGNLGAGSSQNVEIHWDTTGHAGTHTIIAYADPDNIVHEKNETNNSASTSVTVNGYGVHLTVDSSGKNVQPGHSVDYTITVKNTGTLQDTFDLSTSSVAAGWSASLSSNKVTLDAGASTTVTLTVSAPSSANNGDSQDVTVTAVSEGDSSKSDSVTTTTTVSSISITTMHIYNHLEAVINFTTSQSVKAYIKYGIGPNHMNMQTPEESAASTYHEFAIQNLTPQITYYFKVHMTDGTHTAWSSIYEFTLTGKNDFEQNDNSNTLYNWNVDAYNYSSHNTETSIWQWGTPSNVGPSSAHSGSKLIGTVLNGNYGVNNHVDALITPWIDLTNATWVTLSFYAWYDLEADSDGMWDGVTMAFMNDSSSAWWLLDYNNNASQYDGKCASDQGLNNTYIFGGNSGGWVLKTFNTSAIHDPKLNRYLLGHKVRFIFYFESDEYVNNFPGFYFDDIQIKAGIPQYHIYGYVKDSSGTPVSGATVWVNDTTLGISYKTTTDSSGRYDVYTYNGIAGDDVEVNARTSEMSGTASGTLSNAVEIDINMSAVPEFTPFSIIVIIAALMLYTWRRRH